MLTSLESRVIKDCVTSPGATNKRRRSTGSSATPGCCWSRRPWDHLLEKNWLVTWEQAAWPLLESTDEQWLQCGGALEPRGRWGNTVPPDQPGWLCVIQCCQQRQKGKNVRSHEKLLQRAFIKFHAKIIAIICSLWNLFENSLSWTHLVSLHAIKLVKRE